MSEEYQEIDLLELGRIVLGKWWLILLLICVSSGTAFFTTKALVTPIYQASTTVFIGKESTKIADISLMDIQVGDQLVTDYNQLVKTNLVMNRVIDELALKATPGELVSHLSVETIKDSRFMRIAYEDPNPDMAVQVVNKVSDLLKIEAENVVGVKNVVIVDYATKPKTPVRPSRSKNMVIAGVLGMAVAVCVILLQHMLDNTFKKEQDVEKELGLPVLGLIPVFKGEERS